MTKKKAPPRAERPVIFLRVPPALKQAFEETARRRGIAENALGVLAIERVIEESR